MPPTWLQTSHATSTTKTFDFCWIFLDDFFVILKRQIDVVKSNALQFNAIFSEILVQNLLEANLWLQVQQKMNKL